MPEYEKEFKEIVDKLYKKLTEKNDLLTFDKIVSVFYARNHPDFKSGRKADYEIKKEFFECL